MWGFIPLAVSCTARRLEKVVFPEEEGPAMSTNLTSGLPLISPAISATPAFLQSFRYQSQMSALSLADAFVQIPDAVDAHALPPSFRLLLDFEKFP